MARRLTIQLLGWNSSADLPVALAGLKEVPPQAATIRYIDNHSRDNSVALVRQSLPNAEILQLSANLGYGGGHNAGFAVCDTEFVLTLNPDCQISWSGISTLVESMREPRVAAVTGLLYRGKASDKPYPQGFAAAQENIIDSAGIELSLALNGIEIGAGEVDEGQYRAPRQTLAVTGACGLYRLAALREIAHAQGEIFDKDFMAYKEDVDLGWRLKRASWRVLFVPTTIGWHNRALRRQGILGWGLNPVAIYNRLRNRRTYYSIRNWLWMVTKNATLKQIVLQAIFIDGRFLLLLLLSLLYPPLLRVWPETIRGLPKMLAKRDTAGAG